MSDKRIRLVLHQKDKDVLDSFSIMSNGPVRVDVIRTEDGHLLAHVYNMRHPGEDDEPIGAYDSLVENKEWEAVNGQL